MGEADTIVTVCDHSEVTTVPCTITSPRMQLLLRMKETIDVKNIDLQIKKNKKHAFSLL